MLLKVLHNARALSSKSGGLVEIASPYLVSS